MLVGVALLLFGAPRVSAALQSKSASYAKGQLIVKYKPSVRNTPLRRWIQPLPITPLSTTTQQQ